MWMCWSAEVISRVVAELQSVGFVYQNVSGVDLFLDGLTGSVRSGIRILFAGEKVRPEHPLASPDVSEWASRSHRVTRPGGMTVQPR